MNRKFSRALITAISVLFLALCLSVGVTASKSTVGTVSKLKATTTSATATLKWSKAKNAKGYQVSVKSGKKWKTVATVSSTTCKIDGLKAGKSYTYRVKAYGKNGKKKVWAKKTKSISVLTAPKKVNGLKTGVSGKTATLKWKKTTGATGYVIYQYSSSKKKYVEIKRTTSLKATVKKLEVGKTYKFAVKAYSKKDKKTTLSSSYVKVSATVNPDNISSLKVKSKTTDTVTINWKKAKGATAYAVYKYNTKNGKWTTLISSTKNTTVTIGKLSPDTSYIFGVRALTKPGKKTYYSSKYMQVAAVTNKKAVTITVPTTPAPTTKPSVTNAPSTTTKPATTVPLKFPSTKAETAETYNQAINNFKAYTGKTTVFSSEHNDFQFSESIISGILTNNFKGIFKSEDSAYTFENGIAEDSTGYVTGMNGLILPYNISSVTANDISSAIAYKNSDGGFTMTLIFPTEHSVVTNEKQTQKPVHLTKAMNVLDLGALNTVTGSAALKIVSCDLKLSGAIIRATVDSSGRLIDFEADYSLAGPCTLRMGENKFNTKLSQTVKNKYLINYSDGNFTNAAPVSLTVNSYGYGNGVIYVEVDPSNWDGNFVADIQNITLNVNGTALDTPATCTVPSKKIGSIYEIKISVPEQSVNSGDVVSFTIPTGIVKNETGTQYNLSYSSSVTV